MDKTLVLFHPSAEREARDFASGNDEFELVETRWLSFSDSFPNSKIDAVLVEDRDVVLFVRLDTLKTCLEQIAVTFALPRYLAASVLVKITALPAQDFGAELLWSIVDFYSAIIHMLSLTPHTRSGAVRFDFNGADPVREARNICIDDSALYDGEFLDFPEGSKKRKPIIFAPDVQLKLAHEIARDMEAEVGRICYEDGQEDMCCDLFAQNHELYNQDVIFLAALENPEECIRQLACMYKLAEQRICSLKVIIPFFPVGTMERVQEEGEIATAMTLSRMISGIPMILGRKPAIVTIFDIHALAGRFFFTDQVLVNLASAMPLVKEWIGRISNPYIIFPDEGAFKRFGKDLQGFDKVICKKIRDGEKRIIMIVEGDPRGKHCIVLDDIALSCTTACECGSAMKNAGAATVDIVFMHAVCPGESEKKLAWFGQVRTTDSCPSSSHRVVANLNNAELFELKPLIIEALKK